ncbi:MAG: sigma-54 dependent transcriptional regulator [Melioribacteraceae bacterium]|nr:sigma-54 dependent transcriptional regulator [Melioribacteraceae bacterium]
MRVQKTLAYSDENEIVKIFSDGKTAVEFLNENHNEIDIVIMDFQIAGGLMGKDLIKKIKEINICLQIIVITKMTLNINDYDFAQKLLDSGAFWYCTKFPNDIKELIYQPTDFIISVKNAFEKKKLVEAQQKSNTKFSNEIEKILDANKLLGDSSEINKVKKIISHYAQSDGNVLIEGESGTGKELAAINLHYLSKRKFDNFVTVNCAGIPKDLLESELFGFEKGAFTGADKAKKGLLEIADGGTVFFDEIGELTLSAQVKLLRFLESGDIEKIGRQKRISVDVRVIAATNRDLLNMTDAGEFREDLFFRLNVFPVKIPPLRERRSDIVILLKHFLGKYAKEFNVEVPQLSREQIHKLNSLEWKGNVRELRSVAQRMLLVPLSEDENDPLSFMLENLTSRNNPSTNLNSFIAVDEIISLKDFRQKSVKEYVRFVRKNSSTDIEAATKLGISASNYSRLVSTLELK